MTPRVLVNGPASWNTLVQLDVLPPPTPHMVTARGWSQGLGGTSAGKALSLARLAVPVRLRTVLGDDDAARQIRDALTHPMLDLRAEVVPGPSERHLNLMSGAGERVSVYLDTPGAPGPDPDGIEDLQVVEVAVLDLAPHSVPLLAPAAASGAEVWCDLHDDDGTAAFHAPFRAAADVVVVSAERLPDVDRYLRERLDDGARWAVATRGSRGAVAMTTDGDRWEVGVAPVDRVVDTNGAGDAFVTGMLAARLSGRGPAEALRWGAAAGALCVGSADLVAADLTVERVREVAELVPVDEV